MVRRAHRLVGHYRLVRINTDCDSECSVIEYSSGSDDEPESRSWRRQWREYEIGCIVTTFVLTLFLFTLTTEQRAHFSRFWHNVSGM